MLHLPEPSFAKTAKGLLQNNLEEAQNKIEHCSTMGDGLQTSPVQL